MKETFLGVDVSSSTYEQLNKQIFDDIRQNRQSMIVAINPEKILKAQDDPDLMELLNKADYQIPDGVGVLFASRLNKGGIQNRITGIDMFLTLCEQAALYGKSVFLYGAKPGVAEQAKERLLERYPNLKVAGVLDGYIKDEAYIKQTINEANPDILFVALGSPAQEYWMIDNMKDLNVNIFQGVGGSFDVISGRIKRAPAPVQKVGLEWLYRLVLEPWRFKRQSKLPGFLYKVWQDKKSR
ncbi:WecB/TagA/CpsF family glycosyltransferase [Halobacillus mangrovi]|uniref:N-acetylglucosaminyldiphosphoundecaprenol N-acetyl-beta-D-mannosaminyltransferase n=1 Tax=Halobacillus mangrovi TaxID=402384 RepID=A0A1W5ZSH4_9BACI|nr:WecB/TagA/CpsF family glycosyltransferase [Halobacillus mangrovi]ARI76215.1 glycosyltransferase [Halobacillus mangrovi]